MSGSFPIFFFCAALQSPTLDCLKFLRCLQESACKRELFGCDKKLLVIAQFQTSKTNLSDLEVYMIAIMGHRWMDIRLCFQCL